MFCEVISKRRLVLDSVVVVVTVVVVSDGIVDVVETSGVVFPIEVKRLIKYDDMV